MKEVKSWADMNVGQLIQVRVINKDIKDDETKVMTIAGMLVGKSYREMMDMPLAETRRLIANTAFLYTKPNKVKMKARYELNGTTYIPLKKMEEMTTAQYIDYQAISKESAERVAEFLAIFMIPEGHKYNDGYDMEKVVNDVLEYLSAEEALSIADFFTKRCVRLIRRTLFLMEAKMKTMKLMGPKKVKEQAKEAEKVIAALRRMYGLV